MRTNNNEVTQKDYVFQPLAFETHDSAQEFLCTLDSRV